MNPDPPNASSSPEAPNYFSLPPEIRLAILEYVFPHDDKAIYSSDGTTSYFLLDETYTAYSHLAPLLASRRFHHDAQHLALQRTTFLTTNLFANIPDRLAALPAPTLSAIRHIAFVVDRRHFRQLPTWGAHAFGHAALRLDTLTIALQRSSFWHYLFDFTADLVKLLRELRGVRRLVFVRNGALVKGSFKTWYNRLVGLVMKVDHAERFERAAAPRCESTWWRWGFEEREQRFWLEAVPPKPRMEEEEYLQAMLPLMEELRVSIENEEWNPDPRSRMLYP